MTKQPKPCRTCLHAKPFTTDLVRCGAPKSDCYRQIRGGLDGCHLHEAITYQDQLERIYAPKREDA